MRRMPENEKEKLCRNLKFNIVDLKAQIKGFKRQAELASMHNDYESRNINLRKVEKLEGQLNYNQRRYNKNCEGK